MRRSLLALALATIFGWNLDAQGQDVTTFPYTQNFDAFTECLAICSVPCELSEDWVNTDGGLSDWTVNSFFTPSPFTGPLWDKSGTGNYLYLESSGNCDSRMAIVESPVFDLSGTACPRVSYSYHMNGRDMGSLALQIRSIDGADSTWSTVDLKIGDKGSFWRSSEEQLPDYIGQRVQFRFVGITGRGYRSDMAIDEFIIGDDEIAPVITFTPWDRNVFTNDTSCGANVSWLEPSAYDDCELSSFVSSHAPGDLFPVGTTVVSYIATDNAGNADTASFEVTVTDDDAPVFTNFPANITVSTEANSCEATVTWSAIVADDNCGISGVTTTHNSGDVFMLGATVVTYTAEDIHGNVRNMSFIVTVVDDMAPTISCPANANVTVDAGACTATVNGLVATADDANCGISSISNTKTGASDDASSAYPIGTTTVIFTATDQGGNTAQCSIDVTVTDNEAPVITNCPSDIVSCDNIVWWSHPTVTDNCGSTTSLDVNRGTYFPDASTTPVTYTVTDGSGNTSICMFNITIAEHPEIEIDSVVDASWGLGRDGAIYVSIVGGAPAYTYQWSNFADTEDIENLFPGWYTLRVTDANGCQDLESIQVRVDWWNPGLAEDGDVTDGMSITEKSAEFLSTKGFTEITLYPNPANESINIDLTSLDTDANVEIFSILGSKKVAEAMNVSGIYTVDVSGYASGQYLARIIANGEATNIAFVVSK